MRNRSISTEAPKSDLAQIRRHTVLSVLSHHIGRGTGIGIAELTRECMNAQHFYGIPDEARKRRVRKLIEELRREGHHICATPADGYFIAACTEELQQTCMFLYQRSMTSLTQVAAMKRVSLPDLEGQLKLRT